MEELIKGFKECANMNDHMNGLENNKQVSHK